MKKINCADISYAEHAEVVLLRGKEKYCKLGYHLKKLHLHDMMETAFKETL